MREKGERVVGRVWVVRTAVCKNTKQYGVYHRRIHLFLTREVAVTGCNFVRNLWRHGTLHSKPLEVTRLRNRTAGILGSYSEGLGINCHPADGLSYWGLCGFPQFL